MRIPIMFTSCPRNACLALALLLLLAAASACSALIPCPPSACTSKDEGSTDPDRQCCNLESLGFDSGDVPAIRWLRAQIDTPEFYPLRCESWQQQFYDQLGRKMCRSGCWGYPLRIEGVSYEPMHLATVSLLLQDRNCTNNFAPAGYWC